MCEASSDRLHPASILGPARRQGHASRHQHAGKTVHRSQCHRHCGQALVARRNSDNAAACGERPNQAPKHLGGVIAVGQRVHHPGRALRATVTRIAAEAGERDCPALAKLDGRLVHEEPDLIVTGVVAQRDGRTVLGANPALGAQDQVLVPPEVGWVPPHPGVLRPAEDIAARQRAQHLRRERQLSRGTLGIGPYLEDRSIIRREESVHPLPVWLIRGNRHGKPARQPRHAASAAPHLLPPDLTRRAHFYQTAKKARFYASTGLEKGDFFLATGFLNLIRC